MNEGQLVTVTTGSKSMQYMVVRSGEKELRLVPTPEEQVRSEEHVMDRILMVLRTEGYSVDQALFTRDRDLSTSHTRSLIAYLARKKAGLGVHRTGHLLGRDNTTITKTVASIRDALQVDKDLRRELNRIIRIIDETDEPS